jgi:hypothetical protein
MPSFVRFMTNEGRPSPTPPAGLSKPISNMLPDDRQNC